MCALWLCRNVARRFDAIRCADVVNAGVCWAILCMHRVCRSMAEGAARAALGICERARWRCPSARRVTDERAGRCAASRFDCMLVLTSVLFSSLPLEAGWSQGWSYG